MSLITTNSLIKGLLITYTDDNGPKVEVNLSELNEISSTKLSLIGMTVLMFGNKDPEFFSKRYYNVYGPIPVPQILEPIDNYKKHDLDALAIIFNVFNDAPSNDIRTIKYGKDIITWFVFDTSDRKKIFDKIEIIEKIAKIYLKKVEYLSQLKNESFFRNLLIDVIEITSDTAPKVVRQVIEPNPAYINSTSRITFKK